MTRNPRITPMRAIEILAYPGANLLDISGPLQVFASANDVTRSNSSPVYDVRLLARETPVTTSAGLGLLAQRLPAATKPVDTLIIAGGGGVHAACEDRDLLRWLVERAGTARRVASVCTGAFLLGAAGLLDGRRAVTHWADCDRLAQAFPKTRVE